MREMSASEPLVTHRNALGGIRTGVALLLQEECGGNLPTGRAVPGVMIHPRPILTRLALAVAVALLLMVSTSHATPDTLVVDLPLEDGGSQRVLYASPARPRAALIM